MPKHQSSNCKIAILVPILNETEDTLRRLFDSLASQEEIDPSEFEVLCLVNNDLPGSKNYDVIYGANQRILQVDWSRNIYKDISVTMLDYSSKGREISNCNIGKIRNILIYESAKRFRSNEHNGILLHIDADVYFNDRLFLRKAIDLFDDPDVIGIAGGKWREAFVEDYPEYNPESLRSAFKQIGLAKQCKELVNFIKGESVLQAFGGSNMFSKCFESIAIGGMRELPVGEDKDFGHRLLQYADENRQKILVAKTELKVVASLRISERTASSFKDDIDRFMSGKKLFVKDPATSTPLAVNRQTFESLKARALRLPEGQELVRYIEDYGILWIH